MAESLKLNYNFVVFGTCDDYYIVSYEELNKYDDVKCIMNYFESSNRFLLSLFRLHTSISINRRVKLPFQNLWYKHIIKNQFKNDKPLCFVFFARNQLCNSEYIDYLKKTYPGCKCVAFWQDLVSQVNVPNFDSLFKDKLDLTLSFDQADCGKYGMTYYPLVYSYHNVPHSEKLPESDVYFVGKAKDRLCVILDAYKRFVDAGLKCDFHITGVKPEERKYSDDIDYCDGLSYLDNLRHIQACKCMLEVMQGGGAGYTLRYAEAIMYDKKIITNNSNISKAVFYNPNYISVFRKSDEIDVRFPIREPIIADYGFKEDLLPSKMLRFIEQNLS